MMIRTGMKTISVITVLLLLCTLFTAVNTSYETAVADTDPDIDIETVKSIAHRGYSSVAPENTIAAFELAASMGFTYVETDISVTADGKYVLLHDTTIDRTSNGSGKITEMTLEQAKSYDFGSWKDPVYAGEKIPTLEEFLDTCIQYGLRPYLEIKGTLSSPTEQIREIVDMVGDKGLLSVTSFISTDIDQLRIVKDYCSTARLGLVTAYVTSTYIKQADSLRTGENEVFLDSSSYGSTVCNMCRSNGMPLEAWTINTAEEMKSINEYITGVTSDSLKYCDYHFTVTNDLTRCGTNNSDTRITLDRSYRAVITPDNGNLLLSVVCKMGGIEQPVNGGVIDIPAVTGNIVITAVAGNHVTLDKSLFVSGYSASYDSLLPDWTVDAVDVGGKTYYGLTDDGRSTTLAGFDIVLSPGSVYELTIASSLTVGIDYRYSLQFYTLQTKDRIDEAYLNDESSIKNCTGCSYDTSWFSESDILTITTGDFDSDHNFSVSINPSSTVQQQYNVCGFRMLVTNGDGTSSVEPDLFSVSIERTDTSVSYDSVGGTQIPSEKVSIGDTASRPDDPVRSGYVFAGWYKDANYSEPYDFSAAVDDYTRLYAKWTGIEYTIRYVTNGGSVIPDGKYTVETGAVLSTSCVKDGCTFGGWYDNDKLSGDPVRSIPIGSTGDRVFYAKWSVDSQSDNTALIIGIVAAIIVIIAIAGLIFVKKHR